MKKKKVWRYYCEYCGKTNCSGGSIGKHEKHCTMNPNRVCRMCEFSSTTPEELSEAMALLPDPDDYKAPESFYGWNEYSHDELDEALELALPKVRDIVDNCPACILAAMRQKGKGRLYSTSFTYKEETQKMWNLRNEGYEVSY